MSKEELLARMARSMARSMEVEGADFKESYKRILKSALSRKK